MRESIHILRKVHPQSPVWFLSVNRRPGGCAAAGAVFHFMTLGNKQWAILMVMQSSR